ncbi:MAG: phosphoribosylamine--glycine ligase [Gammaproteobacteria bacterium]|nr:MAG: phosphoribosylamine--glycine ligase [Gammaproteobacteria bacterium]
MKILIIGAGGREHALAWKFAQDQRVSHIYVAPGNAGTARAQKCQNLALTDIAELKQFAVDNRVDLTLVGSEDWLAAGIVDEFQAVGLDIFGPHQAAAQLEASKAFAKQFMKKHGVKTAGYHEFTDMDKALAHLDCIDFPTVIKADGLAAGKGVIIAPDRAAAQTAIHDMMRDKVFGEAGSKVVIEDFLQGVEASILSFTDGKTILPLRSAKDHKKIGEGETGLNTGGMGVVSPNPFVTDSVYQQFIDDVLAPTLRGLQADNLGFAGVIFFGLMINDDGVFLIEYNMRLGDPETQTVLPLLNTSLVDVVQAGLAGELAGCELSWKDKHATCVVAAAEGYPEAYRKGDVITGTDKMDADSLCFFAGVGEKDGELVTNGGRVLNVVSLDDSLAAANARAYENLKNIHFNGLTYRRDIGADAPSV